MQLAPPGTWDVFLLFSIPIGGGIPAGVLLAKSKGISWQFTAFLYLLSDIALACYFEPLVKWILRESKKSPKMMKVIEAMKASLHLTISKYGVKPGPVMLVTIAFGTDPMTGRAATLYAGHGFITGWMIAILGDMFFYTLIMSSTLWLNSVLGDGTMTALIIMGLMMVMPAIIRKVREALASKRVDPL